MEGQYVAYTFYRVDPSWRRLMPPDARQAQKEEFAELVDSFAERFEHLRAGWPDFFGSPRILVSTA